MQPTSTVNIFAPLHPTKNIFAPHPTSTVNIFAPLKNAPNQYFKEYTVYLCSPKECNQPVLLISLLP